MGYGALVGLTSLTGLSCRGCDISGVIVLPSSSLTLTNFACSDNSITYFSVVNFSLLNNIDCSNNAMLEADIDQLFADLLANLAAWSGTFVNGTLDCSGNAPPSAASDAAIAALELAGWTIITAL
jgi:hypothetical protein